MESKQIKKKKIEKVAYYVNCKYCGKYIESLHLGQLTWNLKIHESQCGENPKKEDTTQNLFNEVKV